MPRSPLNFGTPADWRQRITLLVDDATIDAALRERHLVPELPASVWIDLEQMLDKLERVQPIDRKQFCMSQPEVLRQLLVLFVLDYDATARAMQTKLAT